MIVRKLLKQDYPAALDLAWRVFQRFEAPEYPAQGVTHFQNTLQNHTFTDGLQMYGAFDGQRLVGMIATRNEGRHIALFFVDETYQHRGVGRELFLQLLPSFPGNQLTVNSSPFAVPVYQRLGFVATDGEQLTDGIRYTPMVYTVAKG